MRPSIYITIATIISVLIVTYFSLPRVDQQLKNEAINGCAQAAATAQKGSFNGAVYQICVTDKGYKTNIK